MSRRSHRRRKRTAWIIFAVVAAVAVIVLLAVGGIWLAGELSYQEPIPIGTPGESPTVDQKPVSSSSEISSQAGSSSSAALSDGSSSSKPDSSSASSSSSETGNIETVGSEQVLRGVITDATTSQITVTSDGKTFSFWRETADVTGRIVEGATVDIFYTGTIEGTDTSQAYVTRIVSYS